MQILLISNVVPEAIEEMAKDNRITCQPLNKTPSLVPVVHDFRGDAIVLDQRDGLDFSLPHILSAAISADRRGVKFVVMGNFAAKPYMKVATAENLKEVLTSATAPTVPTGQAQEPPKAENKPPPKPAERPTISKIQTGGHIPLFTVGGTQSRIGCTTQSVQLYYYCKALGFRPAVIATKEAIGKLTHYQKSEEKDNAVYIEGIPFVTNKWEPYDCFISDLGTLQPENQKAFREGDFQVIVAGSKNWELIQTIKTMRFLSSERPIVVLSFCSKSSVAEVVSTLKKKVGKNGIVFPAYAQPDPFSAGSLYLLDEALHQKIEQFVK